MAHRGTGPTAPGLIKIILEIAGYVVSQPPRLFLASGTGVRETLIEVQDARFLIFRPPGRYLLEIPSLQWDEKGETVEATQVSLTYDVSKTGVPKLVQFDPGIREVTRGTSDDEIEKTSMAMADRMLIVIMEIGRIAGAISEGIKLFRGR